MERAYVQLNVGWNADPNVPDPRVEIVGDALLLSFRLNAFQFPAFAEDQRATLRFESCSRYRLGAPNDEGWYSETYGQAGAPPWGEFYEVDAGFSHSTSPDAWVLGPATGPAAPLRRHFLFYLRDGTFECEAAAWQLDVLAAGSAE